jgi:hypothetical protein
MFALMHIILSAAASFEVIAGVCPDATIHSRRTR